MSSLFPPILGSRGRAVPSRALTEPFKVSFTMPKNTDISEVNHVQVLIRRQSDMAPWSNQGNNPPLNVPDKEVIFLSKTAISKIADDYYVLHIPPNCIRGIESDGINNLGSPGFPAGRDDEGENYSIQIRFGSGSLYSSISEYGDWRNIQIGARSFGEWSNTQSFFVYKTFSASGPVYNNIFHVQSDFNDPLMNASWKYTPISRDPLKSIKMSVYNDNGDLIALEDGVVPDVTLGMVHLSGEIKINLLRVERVKIVLSIETENRVSMSRAAYLSIFPPLASGIDNLKLKRIPTIAEENEAGVLGIFWGTGAPKGAFLYRVNRIFRAIKLCDAHKYSHYWDSTIEMGEEYAYVILGGGARGGILTPPPGPGGEAVPLELTFKEKNMNFHGNSFLSDDWRQLKLGYNVAISNLQIVTEGKMNTTLKGRFPIYTRTGDSAYRTFSLQSVLTLNSNDGFFYYDSESTDHSVDSPATLYRKALEDYFNTGDFNNFYKTIIELRAYKTESGRLLGTDSWWLIEKLNLRGDKNGHTTSNVNKVVSDTLVDPGVYSSTIERIGLKNDNQSLIYSRVPANQTFPKGWYEENWITEEGRRGPRTDYQSRVITSQGGGAPYYRNPTNLLKSDQESKKIFIERRFREYVLEWLNNGKPKIYRSETEGNMIVIATNVSLTPFIKNRSVYNLSVSFTEIAEYNSTNLIKYDLISKGSLFKY